MRAIDIIDSLYKKQEASREDLLWLIENRSTDISQALFERAAAVARAHFGNKIYVRGLIEMTNYCRNDCYYCGIRRSNAAAQRYRLTEEDIMQCCEAGYGLGFRTFVLQGGEDMYYTDDMMAEIISAIRTKYPDCAITLSLGEKTRESYQRPTVTCCAMRRRRRNTTQSCIPRNSRWQAGSNACAV